MPIDRKRYPKNWAAISRFIRFVRAGAKCEQCGLAHGATGRWIDGRWYTARKLGLGRVPQEKPMTRIVLATAHLDRDTTNNDYSNLRALCQRCHFIYDGTDNIAKRLFGKYYRDAQHTLF